MKAVGYLQQARSIDPMPSSTCRCPRPRLEHTTSSSVCTRSRPIRSTRRSAPPRIPIKEIPRCWSAPYLEGLGHEPIVTSDKDGQNSDFDHHSPDAEIVISQPFWPAYLTANRSLRRRSSSLRSLPGSAPTMEFVIWVEARHAGRTADVQTGRLGRCQPVSRRGGNWTLANRPKSGHGKIHCRIEHGCS
jgi:hypothetical protein